MVPQTWANFQLISFPAATIQKHVKPSLQKWFTLGDPQIMPSAV